MKKTFIVLFGIAAFVAAPACIDYSAEDDNDPCDGLDEVGECEGSVLRYCKVVDTIDDVRQLVEIDCAKVTGDFVCGFDHVDDEYACIELTTSSSGTGGSGGSSSGTGGSSSGSGGSSSGTGGSSSGSGGSSSGTGGSSSGSGGSSSGGTVTSCTMTFKWEPNSQDNVSWEPLASGLMYVHGMYTKADGSTGGNWNNSNPICYLVKESGSNRWSCSVEAREAQVDFTIYLDGHYWSFDLCSWGGNGDDVGMTNVYAEGTLLVAENQFKPAGNGGVLIDNGVDSLACTYNARFSFDCSP